MSLDRYEPQAVELAQDVAVRRLGEWAQSAEAAHRVAEQLVKTSFVPEGFRGKPYEATAAILAGLEVGLSPMAALRSFDVIQGTAAPRALTLRAVVQSHGHEIELVESTASRCKMRGRRAGAHTWTNVDWTMDRARSLGVAGKANWKSQPQAMLVARATSELARLIAADAILGIGYSAEEIADGAGAGVELPMTIAPTDESTEAPTPGTKRMSRRKPPAAPVEEPIEDADVVDDDKPSEAQTKKAMASFTEQGYESRDDRLAVTSLLVGHTVDSWKDLSKDEASRVIDSLERLSNGEISIAMIDGELILEHSYDPPDDEV